jgi:aspartate aminotransferase-like enzyme/predicted N-acetyltransferase YhbS
MKPKLTFKVADAPAEFEAIHALNYRTFVEEIPQHAPNAERRLVDKFHAENTYLIALAGQQLAGMISLRARRPFSLDAKLPELDAHLPAGRRWVEVRLLAVEKQWRGSEVFAGLMRLLEREVTARGHDAAVVSATTRQRKLYEHLGFEPFGPLVGREGAWYQPMQVTLERFRQQLTRHFDRSPVNLLPGPVAMSAAVRHAFRGEPVSHRSESFLAQVRECRAALRAMTGAPHAALLPGSGTLANEVVAAQIALLDAPGVVVSHGEFGERLADHARRARLPHHHWRQEWGERLDFAGLGAWLDAHPEAKWLWAVHCETSTGAFTPIEELLALCEPRGVRLCLDCVSSLGVAPVDLRRVHLAASTSGKGLAAVAGVGIVFHREPVAPAPDRVPRALDLGLYASDEGVPFTLGSNVLAALHAALHQTDWPAKFARVSELGTRLRDEFLARPLVLLQPQAGPVLTVALPGTVSTAAVADALERAGWIVAARSRHLLERNWLQLCLMGEVCARDLDGLADTLANLVHHPA